MVDHTIGTLQVMPATDKDEVHHSSLNNLTRHLSYCKANGPPPLRTNGYYYADKWIPFSCKVRGFSKTEIKRCLIGKTLHFFGDSTARQFYEFLQEEIGCEDTDLPPPRITSTREFRCSIDQAILHFHFHGLPNGQSKPIPSWSNHYVASEIDNLKGGPDTIIFLSLWAHFSMAGLPFYEGRMRSIRESLHRLQTRSNGTSVIVKGVNTRDYWKKQFILVSSDWHSLKQEQKLRELFQNDTNFGYIDSWEITNVQPFPDQTHPEHIIIKNLVNRLMTYICVKENF